MSKAHYKQQGQTALEFIVLFVVLAASLFVMRQHIQRAFQGKWKSNIESLGELYDPQGTKHSVETMSTNSETIMQVETCSETGKLTTTRVDTTNMWEEKNSTVEVNF